ncbi:MAG: YraN family protein [Planctomycetes bacterium]|nr:YraN family protein [Planctomycetota bacterium]
MRLLDPRVPAFALAGERLVELSLRARGWRFLARRLATRWAELDLLFVVGEVLVVVEVKTGRVGPRHRPGQRLGADSLTRLRAAARGLARGAEWRVDLAEVQLDRARRAVLLHHPDLWRPL